MCDSFDMACRDASNSLHLNIKVNSENLLPNAQKYSVGSLRLPDDPSWPKIPHRRLADDLGEIIEPPCVVTLTGTPRKSHTTVRQSHSHLSSKSPFTKDQPPGSFHQNIHQKTPPPSHPIKRRPGCADPRFKRVTTVKSQVTSTETADRERENPTELSRSALVIPNQTQCTTENVKKSVPEKDTDPPKVMQQQAEKPGEIRGMDSVGVQTMPNEDFASDDLKKTSDVEKSQEDEKLHKEMENPVGSSREISDVKIVQISTNEKTLDEAKSCDEPTVKNEIGDESQINNCNKIENPPSNFAIINSPLNVLQQESASLHQYCQSNAGQIFLVVENKPQSPSLGTMQLESPCQYTTQCYNVQVPVLSYQNLQISTQQNPKVEVSSESSLVPLRTEPIINFAKSEDSSSTERKEIVSSTKNEVSQPDEKNKDLVSSDLESELTRKMLATPPVKLERRNDQIPKFQTVKINSDGISESFKASRLQQLLSDTTDSELYEAKLRTSRARLYSKETSGSGSDCEGHFENRQGKFRTNDFLQTKKKRRNPIYSSTGTSQEIAYSRNYDCTQGEESSMDEKDSFTTRELTKTRNNRKMKSEQNLPRSLPFGGKNYKNISDPHITSRELYVSSTKRKNENRLPETTKEVKETLLDLENLDRRIDEIESDIPEVPDLCETHRTDFSNIEEMKDSPITKLDQEASLPVKTQKLLNKSYMEYYEKLRSGNIVKDENSQQRYICQMAMGAPQLKKRRAEIQPEIDEKLNEKGAKNEVLTMEKLSVLSNIINRNLNPTLRNSSDALQTKRIYVNENMKSSSDPTAATRSAVILRKLTGDSADLYDSSVPSLTMMNKVKRKREKPVEKRGLKLKTIAFFGFMMYGMIVLMPMVYNYFMYEDYEDYEDLSYIELMLEYVVSSFREAFGGLFDTINEIFFQPVSHD